MEQESSADLGLAFDVVIFEEKSNLDKDRSKIVDERGCDVAVVGLAKCWEHGVVGRYGERRQPSGEGSQFLQTEKC